MRKWRTKGKFTWFSPDAKGFLSHSWSQKQRASRGAPSTTSRCPLLGFKLHWVQANKYQREKLVNPPPVLCYSQFWPSFQSACHLFLSRDLKSLLHAFCSGTWLCSVAEMGECAPSITPRTRTQLGPFGPPEWFVCCVFIKKKKVCGRSCSLAIIYIKIWRRKTFWPYKEGNILNISGLKTCSGFYFWEKPQHFVALTQ